MIEIPKNLIRILLIEDDEADAVLFQRSLTGCVGHYQTHVCATMESSLCWLENNQCDVILLDLSLPDSSGIDSISEIHQRLSSVPIVMLTGLDDDNTALAALDNGAQDYLIKGESTPRELERTLRHAIQRQQIQNENRRLVSQLRQAARSDSLTGVLNRHAMLEVFKQHWTLPPSTVQPLSCVIFDIDYFKKINDTYGHLAGDEVLRTVARTISEVTRPSDCIARYGGEEFCVILPETTQQQAVEWAQLARIALASYEFDLSGNTVQVTASFGVAQRSQQTKSIEALIDLADRSLMLAKSSGRNQVHTLDESGNAEHSSTTSLGMIPPVPNSVTQQSVQP